MKKLLAALVFIIFILLSGIAYAIVNNSESGSAAIHSAGYGSYVISNSDTSGDPQYFGYVNSTGNWYILQYGVAAGTFRYTQGTTGYATGWTNRASQTYDYFYNLTW